MSYRIGSFNCLNFGKNSKKDVELFAKIIVDEKFDIIALQEIIGQPALNIILNELNKNKLRGPWDGIADSRVNDYAFIWNTRKFKLAVSEEGQVNRVFEPSLVQQYRIDKQSGQTDLKRKPFYARFFPTGAPFIELRIINTHIRYGKGTSNDPFDENPQSPINMRKNEFDVLTKAIYAKMADKRYGTNRPAYTILLGDYNLNLRQSGASSPYLCEKFTIEDGKSNKIITTHLAELTTLKKPRNPEDQEAYGFSSNYDHFTIDSERFKGVSTKYGTINTVEHYYNGDYREHKNRLSDHIPIVMELDIREG